MFRTLTPILSLVIAVTVFFTITQPQFDDVRAIEDETMEYEEAIKKAAGLNAELQSLTTQKNSFSAGELKRLETLVPDNVNEVRLLIDLESIAKSHGMYVSEVSITEGSVSSLDTDKRKTNDLSFERDFVPSNISLGLIGTYEQLRDTLSDIEKSLSLVEITNITFSVGDTDLQEYALTLQANALVPLTQQ